MPGTPLTLSIESPISASTSTTCAGATPNFSHHAVGVVPGAFVARVVDADAVADQLEEVLVAGDDRRLEAVPRRPCVASVPITSSASKPSDVRIGTPIASHASCTHGTCSARSPGIGARLAL